MSSNRQETVADIVREMRKRAQEVYEGQTGYPESWEDQMNDDEIREIADRIETAAKLEREVGAEKMRENLGEVMHKKYTAQKIREMEAIVASVDMGPMTRENVALMLRQAAEMLDRLDEDIWRESTREKSSAVGNAAAMREALEKVLRVLHCAIVADILKGDDVNSAFNEVTAALSAPPRNCDVGTSDEQAKRFHSFCKKFQYGIQGMCSTLCPCKDCCDKCHCLVKWSQMPYEEGGEE